MLSVPSFSASPLSRDVGPDSLSAVRRSSPVSFLVIPPLLVMEEALAKFDRIPLLVSTATQLRLMDAQDPH